MAGGGFCCCGTCSLRAECTEFMHGAGGDDARHFEASHVVHCLHNLDDNGCALAELYHVSLQNEDVGNHVSEQYWQLQIVNSSIRDEDRRSS